MLAIQAKIRVLRSRKMVSISLAPGGTTIEMPSASVNITATGAATATGVTGKPLKKGRFTQTRSAGLLLRSMYKTVIAGSVVVVFAIMCNLPVIIATEYINTVHLSTTGRTVAYLVSNFQYIAPSVTYYVFYANFRRCAMTIFGGIKQKLIG